MHDFVELGFELVLAALHILAVLFCLELGTPLPAVGVDAVLERQDKEHDLLIVVGVDELRAFTQVQRKVSLCAHAIAGVLGHVCEFVTELGPREV